MRPIAFILVLACAKAATPEKPADIQQHVTLQKAASCTDLESTVHDTAVRQMRLQLDAEKSWNSGPVGIADGGAATPGATPSAAGAPVSYTTTNVQVAGVDEADFVKNDGTRIFVLSGHRLYAATSWPPQDLSVSGSLEIEGWPTEMFLDGDKIAVFSGIWAQEAGALCALNAPCPYYGLPTTKVTVVDVSDLSAPKSVAELYLPGWSGGSRRVGSSIRLILSDNLRWPEKVKWWPDYSPSIDQDHDKWIAALDALEDANEAIIRATPLSAWFPPGQRKLPDGTLVDLGYDCGQFYLANAPERLGLVTIATIDLASTAVSRASIVGEPGVVYATQKHLYVASRHWWWWLFDGQRDWTYVHEFDIEDPQAAGYVGSGGVEGIIGDQFAMDEKDGYLRIATSTATETYDAKNKQWHVSASSRLSVLAPSADGSLALVGEIPSLVDNERLMATRFIGDKGYAVTFRNVDPLVTLDLSDPAHPRKVAELTIPGFSTYLQPIDDDHLLAIGEELPLDSSGHADWSKRSVQLSLFDVSDLSAPKRTAQALVGTAWAYSEALWDHHAFNWYRPDPAKPGLLAIPFSDWIVPTGSQSWYDGFVSDVRVFSVDPAGTIAPAGSLGMSDVYVRYGSGNWTWWYRPWVRRSVMATDQSGNTFVYAVSDAGLRSAALNGLDKPLATALFAR
jgi:uncharacterized secreted protein with C-terminal beta-propeller domain